MPYRPPLVPFEVFVADPPDLPVRGPGEPGGLSALVRAEVLASDPAGVTFKGTTSDGGSLAVQLSAAGEGVIRVRLSEEPDARSRSARALPLVPPRLHPALVEVAADRVRVDAGAVIAEIMLDPRMNPWDCAPLLPILREAGGHYTTWKGEATIWGPDGVGTNAALHDEVMGILRNEKLNPAWAGTSI